MADADARDDALSLPRAEARRRFGRRRGASADREREPGDGDWLGRAMESIARGMGTPMFLIILTIFVAVWMAWNSVAPEDLRFDSADIGFTALTLMLSLQASYAAPMLLLAQNRQDDRDRVQIEQDRQRAERNTADLEYLAREIVALRILVKDMATKDFIRAELRSLLEDIEELDEDEERGIPAASDAERRAPRTGAEQLRERRGLDGDGRR